MIDQSGWCKHLLQRPSIKPSRHVGSITSALIPQTLAELEIKKERKKQCRAMGPVCLSFVQLVDFPPLPAPPVVPGNPGYQKGSGASMSSPLGASSTGACPPPPPHAVHAGTWRQVSPHTPVSFCPLNTRRPPITELRPPRRRRRGHCGSSVLAELQCGTRWLLALRQRGAPALLYGRRFYEYMYEHGHERKLGRGRH